MSDDPATRFRENATEITSLVVTGLWLGLLLSGVGGSLWLVVLIVGYAAVIPIVDRLFGNEADPGWDDEGDRDGLERDEEPEPGVGTERTDGPDGNVRDALETLRNRYARGELTDEQFERKLERLLETDTVENADEWARDRTTDGQDERDRDLERE